MGKVINYLQQPGSIHALTALLLNTKAFGSYTIPDMIEWFDSKGATVNIHELNERWRELAQLGFAKSLPGGFRASWGRRIRKKIGYVLTEKGETATQAIMDCISYIGKLQGGERNTREKQTLSDNSSKQR